MIGYALAGPASKLWAFWAGDDSTSSASTETHNLDSLNARRAVGLELRLRNSTNAKIAASLSDGTAVMLGEFVYKVESSAKGAASASNDLGVDGLVPFGQAFAGHFGIEISGDQSTKIQAAFLWSATTCQSVMFPKGVYRSDTRLSVHGPLKILGEGDDTIFDFSAFSKRQTLIEMTQIETDRTTLSNPGPLSVGTETIALLDARNYSVGDMILLRSTELFSTTARGVADGNKKGELGIVTNKSGSSITLSQGLRDSYSGGTISVTRVRPNTRPVFKNFRIKGGGVAARQWGLRIDYAIYPEVTGVSFEGVEDTGVSLSYCDGGHVHRCVGDNIAGIVSETGYAFGADLMTRDAIFENLRTNGSSCLFSTGGLYAVWDIQVFNCIATNTASVRPAIQTHINGVRTSVYRCTVKGATLGIGMFGPYSRIKNNVVTDCSNSGIYTLDEGSAGIVVSGNTLRKCLTGINLGPNSGSRRAGGFIDQNRVIEGIGGSAGISCTADDMTIGYPHISGYSPGMIVQGDRVTVNYPYITNAGLDGNHFGFFWLGDDGRIIGGGVYANRGRPFTYGIVVTGQNLSIGATEIDGISDTNAIAKAASIRMTTRSVTINGKILSSP